MFKHIVYTETSKELLQKLNSKCSLFEQYNSNVGYFLSSFYIKASKLGVPVNNKDWNGDISFNKGNYLYNILPKRSIKEIFDEMIADNILSISRDYNSGIQSKRYNIISDDFWNDTEYKITAIKNKTLLNNIQKLNDKAFAELPEEYKIVARNLEHFNLRFYEANQYISDLLEHSNFFQDKSAQKNSKKKNANSTAAQLYMNYKLNYELFQYYNHLRKDQYGRAHHKLTNLNKIGRQFIEIDGSNKTATVDIKTSQPRFFANMLSDLRITDTEFKNELNKLYDVLAHNDFYEDFITIADLKREDKKSEVFKNILYGDRRFMQRTELYKEYKEKYPVIEDTIRKITHNKPSNFLATEMQRAESNFIYKKLVPTISKYFPNEKYATIHDSIHCKNEVANDIQATMVLCYSEHYKQPLVTTIENYN